MTHPTEDELIAFFADRLTPADSGRVATHLDGCAACRESAERLTEVPRDLWASLVSADPGRSAARSGPPAVPGYEGLRELGRGGCGVVYLAVESATGREVAIKVLRGGALASPAEHDWFRAEARAAANLHHPNVVTILAVGEAHELPYYVMEYLPAGSLARRLDGTPLDPAEAAALAEAVAGAVQHAHERGVIHRDLKPGNILLGGPGAGHPLGVPKVSDFGMAKQTATAGTTPTQAVFGTPSYMAPEQAFGRSRDVGPAADVYALGAVLYEMLTGRPPFRGATPYETLLLVRTADPVPLRRLRAGLPRDLETVCLKCLDKAPDRRYATASALVADLRAFREGRPVAARPVGWAGRLSRWVRREPKEAGLLGLLAAVVAASLAGLTVLWRKAEADAGRAATHAAEADRSRIEARRALVLYAATSRRLFRSPESVTPDERAALTNAIGNAGAVLSARTGDPDEEHDAAFALLQLADSLYNLGEVAAAVAPCRSGVAILKRLAEAHPGRDRFVFHYAQGCSQLAGTLDAVDPNEEAYALVEEAVRAGEVVLARRPASAEVRGAVADFRRKFARNLLFRGDPAGAERALAPSVQTVRELFEAEPTSAARYSTLAALETELALVRFARERSADEYRRLADGRLAAFGRCKPFHGRPDWNIALRGMVANHVPVAALDAAGRPAEATAVLDASLAAAAELAELEPTSAGAAIEFAKLLDLDARRRWAADPAGAGVRFRSAARLLEQYEVGAAELALLLATCPDPGLRNTRRAVAVARAVKADPHDRTALGVALLEDGDFVGARDVLIGCVAGRGTGSDSGEPVYARAHLAVAYRELGDADNARRELRAFEAGFRPHTRPNFTLAEARRKAWRAVEGKEPPPLPR